MTHHNPYQAPASRPPTPLHFIGAVFFVIFAIFGLSIWGASPSGAFHQNSMSMTYHLHHKDNPTPTL